METTTTATARHQLCAVDLLVSDEDYGSSRTREIAMDPDFDPVTEDPEVEDSDKPASSSRTERLVVQGAATGTKKWTASKGKPATAAADDERSRRRLQGNQASVDVKPSKKLARGATRAAADIEDELSRWRDEVASLRDELALVREEKRELESAFRRLDQEIGNGYNLVERKEKELRIAELLTKNQKVAQLLEKELLEKKALQTAHAELQQDCERGQEQLALLRQVLQSAETKNAALLEANQQLTATNALTQEHAAQLQDQCTRLQMKVMDSSSGQRAAIAEYEDRIRSWEVRFTELQRRLEDKTQALRLEQERSKALELELEHYAEQKDAMEREMTSTHERLIQMNGAMTAMQATVEASVPETTRSSMAQKMRERVRLLEEELLSKNRQLDGLRAQIDERLTVDCKRASHRRDRRRLAGGDAASEINSLTRRIATLSDRLKRAEDARDHKTRCLDVLLGLLPSLLQQLDAMQDAVAATNESNAILKSAVAQLQGTEREQDEDGDSSKSAVALAREAFVLSPPYDPELLMGFGLCKAFESSVGPVPRVASVAPFHVVTGSTTSVEASDKSVACFCVQAESGDASGRSFLNRCKINPFLQLVQGNAHQKRRHANVVAQLVEKIAELLSRHRDALHRHATETAFFKAAMATTEREVRQLHARVKLFEAEEAAALSRRGRSADADFRQRLLIRCIDLLSSCSAERQTTFLTQPDLSSDLMVLQTGDGQCHAMLEGSVHLDLSQCSLGDADLEPLLLKISVSGLRVRELRLDGNAFTDDGAATLAAFLETCPPSLKHVDLSSNPHITAFGLSRIRDGLARNVRFQQVAADASGETLRALTVNQLFDDGGVSTTALTVVLPRLQRRMSDGQERKAAELTQQLEARGVVSKKASLRQAEAAYRPRSSSDASTTSRPKSAAVAVRAKGRASRSDQREQTLRTLDAAIRRASQPAAPELSRRRAFSVTQMQQLLSRSARATATPAMARRLAKMQFAQSHLSTIRGLKR
ncbi:hypothetical protein ATCC90586_003745 [Pythium insidiosum]|nr:hypothetical protein ATCC90586_003745 [Pythium insidiosum]